MRELPRLIAITSGTQAPQEATSSALAATQVGLPGILVREPTWTDRDVLECVERLRAESDTLWIAIHDRIALARHECVDAVHLGFRSLTPSEARRLLPEDRHIGFSSHANDTPAAWIGADYRFFGPVHETPSKAGLLEPTGMSGLHIACTEDHLPVYALGGIQPVHVAECMEHGAYGLATLSDVLPSADPGASTARWLEALAGVESLR